jgi:myo-inositol catabolism protein IolS
MEYRKLGRTDMEVSEISFGCWTMGGLNWVNGQPNGWADVDEEEITAAIKIGLDAGVNHFDNADVYGNGRAERMLAGALERLGVESADLIIASKVGHFAGTAEHAYEPAHIRHQCEQSLINLRRDHIDLYYFHHGDFGPNDRYLDDAVEMMNRLVGEGKVRYKGLSAYSEDDFERLAPIIEPHVLQGHANALRDRFLRPGSRLQQLMETHDLALVTFSPLGRGLLLDKFDPEHPPQFEAGDHRRGREDFQAEALAQLKPKLAKIKERFGATTEELASVALNFVLAHPRVACVIPGFRNPRQAECNVSAAGRKLTEEEVAFVRQTFA